MFSTGITGSFRTSLATLRVSLKELLPRRLGCTREIPQPGDYPRNSGSYLLRRLGQRSKNSEMQISKGVGCCSYFFCCLKSHQPPGRILKFLQTRSLGRWKCVLIVGLFRQLKSRHFRLFHVVHRPTRTPSRSQHLTRMLSGSQDSNRHGVTQLEHKLLAPVSINLNQLELACIQVETAQALDLPPIWQVESPSP